MSKNPRLKNSITNPTTSLYFESLYKKMALPLMKFIVKRMGGNYEDAEEVFSKTIIAAWNGFTTFEHKSKFFTWMCRIALNKIADYYREEVHSNSLIVAPFLEEIANYDSRELTPEQWYVLNELCKGVKDCIKLLPKDLQKLIYLRYWKDMAIKQIAKQFGVSERAIEGKLYRARKRLDEIIFQEHPEIIPEYLKSGR